MPPEVLLSDEITSVLDPELVDEVLHVVEQLARDGMTLILATHELRFARDVGTHLVFMHHGKVHESGAPKNVFRAPQTGIAEVRERDRLSVVLAELRSMAASSRESWNPVFRRRVSRDSRLLAARHFL